MYKTGSHVYHEEYGWGRFVGVFGERTRVAVVEFNRRGPRYFTLPTRRLWTARRFRVGRDAFGLSAQGNSGNVGNAGYSA